MRKLFTFAAAVLASMAMMAETVTLDLALAKGSTPAPSIGEALLNGGAFDGSGYKMGSDDNFIGWNIAAAEQTFSEVSFTGYINTTSTDKNWGFQFSTDGGTTWGDVLLQANDGNKSYHEIAVSVTIPEGANALRIIRKAGTSTYVSSITLTLGSAVPPTPSTDPVGKVTIEGPTAGLVGQTATYTATTDVPATTYQWWLGMDKIQGATTNKLEYTPTAAGSYTFMCSASNDYNQDSKLSNTITLVVTDPADACGEIIKATHVNKNTATVTGVLGGTADKSTQDNGKLGSNGHYFGIKLSAGKFQAGDEVTIVASVLNGGNTATIYADKGTSYLGSADFDTESMAATFTLEDETEWIYVYRTSSACNPNIDYISVNRSCEASNNANIKNVWVMAGDHEMTFEPEADGVTYNLVVPATEDIPELTINFSLAHPKATANVSSPFVLTVPAAGAPANSKQIIVTAEDGTTTKTYTINVSKSAEASHDASLKSLSVTGYTLDPAFASDVYTYTITKAYGAENPGKDKLVYELNDPTAHDKVAAVDNSLVVTITAEDQTTQLVYTINIVEAAAKKDLLEVAFSNGVHGYITNGEITVPYLAGETEPTFVSAKFWNADGEPTAEMVNGKLVVTGIDGQTAEYTINYHALTPMTTSYDEITFDGVPDYIYSVYGWAEDKGVKFSKDVEEATNHRISEGKDRIYIALPVAKDVILTSGSGGARPVIITVNGKVRDIEKTAASDGTITIPLVAQEGANLVGIESNGNNGDAGFIKLQLVEGTGTAIENTDAAIKATKVVRDGQMMILKNGVLYNMQGAVVK